MIAIIKYKGCIYRVEAQPFERIEQVMDRAWYIAKKMETDNISYETAYYTSLEWLYTKYLKVSY